MSNKQFSDRLNQELDKMEVPKPLDERIEAFSKLLNIPRFKAEAMINGHVPSEPAILEKVMKELEVDSDWLLGKNDA